MNHGTSALVTGEGRLLWPQRCGVCVWFYFFPTRKYSLRKAHPDSVRQKQREREGQKLVSWIPPNDTPLLLSFSDLAGSSSASSCWCVREFSKHGRGRGSATEWWGLGVLTPSSYIPTPRRKWGVFISPAEGNMPVHIRETWSHL
jgi:hypothetical protein